MLLCLLDFFVKTPEIGQREQRETKHEESTENENEASEDTPLGAVANHIPTRDVELGRIAQ